MPEGMPSSFALLYQRLLICDTQRRLPGDALTPQENLTDEECGRLLAMASLLALSDGSADRTTAYEIATRIVTIFGGHAAFIRAADFILGRLGNFPGRGLLRRRHTESDDEYVRHPAYLKLESLAREVENTIEEPNGEPRLVTDFQFETFNAFRDSNSVSISAPTSAGKSFILSLEIIRKLRSQKEACIVYIVPTRALIRQVISTIRESLIKARLFDVSVRSVPVPIARNHAKNGVIYVLTQERLLSLLHSSSDAVWITGLIVDEAQGIGDGARGVLLHAAIDEVINRFAKTDVVFASPLARNPEYLLRIFRREFGRSILEQHSPVSQNLILVERSNRPDNALNFVILVDNEPIKLGPRKLKFPLSRGVLSRRARFALSIASEDACCIIYANGARDSEKLADEVAGSLIIPPEIPAQMREFIAFLRNHIHRDYGLINVLRKRVAFHYSNMPSSVRSGVEELCKNGHLRFICCTSTLLQGINLPARDIVIENPKRGMGKPMKRGDFTNLAGRAGRLLREFHGNVWCLRPDLWEERSFEGEQLQQIQSSYEQCLADGGTAIRQIVDGDSGLDDRERETAITALGRIYTEFVLSGRSLINSVFRTESNEASLSETMDALRKMPLTIPPEIITKNYGILPTRLENLYKVLSVTDDPRTMIPIQPFAPGNRSRFFSILEVVERILQEDYTSRYRYYYQLAINWVHQWQLSQIISGGVNYRQAKTPSEIRNAIYQIIEDLEKVIRFRLVKHFRAYNDVLSIVLRQRGFFEEADRLVPMHIFLECGATDPVALGLISIGLSRTCALLIKSRIHFPRDSSPERCTTILKAQNLSRINLPAYCKREIETLLYGSIGLRSR